ncbi:hypothetical protein [Kushneria phyllosphaerae]|uniref:Uncharacterized protein n=1 Tax=Kushneria phyllosphaerae TaxID=2100822 RepID=A0A2R8CQQ6_9GAMM|nr:hypothetical protein [Kushneria phyllosphaerae]SPJ35221.1 hypothetical protein KSP9073_03279 [Kushneria phyllosphaerae]
MNGAVMMPVHIQRLSENHPLRTDPTRSWPYVVTVGYRAKARQIVERRRVYVRATSPELAERDAVMYCRNIACPVRDEAGRLLKPSRALASRPLDKNDAIGGGA